MPHLVLIPGPINERPHLEEINKCVLEVQDIALPNVSILPISESDVCVNAGGAFNTAFWLNVSKQWS